MFPYGIWSVQRLFVLVDFLNWNKDLFHIFRFILGLSMFNEVEIILDSNLVFFEEFLQFFVSHSIFLRLIQLEKILCCLQIFFLMEAKLKFLRDIFVELGILIVAVRSGSWSPSFFSVLFRSVTIIGPALVLRSRGAISLVVLKLHCRLLLVFLSFIISGDFVFLFQVNFVEFSTVLVVKLVEFFL